MEDNLAIFNACRRVPAEYQREISSGPLKGMTDINPVWRFEKLTELFGPCGIGWWYEITGKHLERIDNTDTIKAFVDINLYYIWNGETSRPVPGSGGSTFSDESWGKSGDDECFKKALTDAISVACKALGIGADIYYGKNGNSSDGSKYCTEEAGTGHDINQPDLIESKRNVPLYSDPIDATAESRTHSSFKRIEEKHNSDSNAMMSFDEARQYVIQQGKLAGRTIWEANAERPEIVRYYADNPDRYKALGIAAKVFLDGIGAA